MPRWITYRLTDDVRAGLGQVVLQADTRALIEGVARVAQWTVDPAAREDLTASRRRAGEMLAASGRGYLADVAALGMRVPWALEVERVTVGSTARATLWLTALAPLAAAVVALTLLGPPGGYAALRWKERWAGAMEAL